MSDRAFAGRRLDRQVATDEGDPLRVPGSPSVGDRPLGPEHALRAEADPVIVDRQHQFVRRMR